MKKLPAAVDLSKLDIAHTHGVNLAAVGAEYADNISQLRDAAEGKPVAPEAKKKRPRYGRARKVEMDGHRFDSEGEAGRYRILVIRMAVGEIRDLEVHPTYSIAVNGLWVYDYTPDFRYYSISEGVLVVEDYKSKGTRTKDTWPIIKRLMRATYGITVREVTKGDA